MSDKIIIATRESPLALWQAEHVQDLLSKRYPAKNVELLNVYDVVSNKNIVLTESAIKYLEEE